MRTTTHTDTARLYSINDTCRILGIGRTTVYKLISQNQLLTVKIGRSTRVQASSINAVVGDVA